MADEILIKYKVDASDFNKVGVAINEVTKETQTLQQGIKAAFASGAIDAATAKLVQQGDVMGALVNKYGSATSALKAMEKELATMSALGQRGTAAFNELATATAHLKDSIGDTRNEIKKMASDTRVFDTMVQGARGVAAAFSVATGVAAAFGDENKDLQKTLLKVQGAMAALQGVQELANIATEKGGIATKAYGAALQVVDKISKVTGLSMAASWALATAGITVVIAGVVALIDYLSDAKTKSQELQEQEAKRKKQFGDGFSEQLKAIDELDARQENELKRKKIQKATDKELFDFEKRQNIERLSLITQLQKDVEYNRKTNAIDDKTYTKLSTELEKQRLDTLLNLRKEFKEKAKKIDKRDKVSEIEITGYSLPDAPPKDKVKNFLEGVQRELNTNIQKIPEVPVKLVVSKRSIEEEIQDAAIQMSKFFDTYGQTITKAANAVSDLTKSIFAQETKDVEKKYNEQTAIIDEQLKLQLKGAGDNAEQKRVIEERAAKKKADLDKKLAIEKAKISRQEAIAEKSFAIFNIILSTAQAVAKALEKGPAGYALAAIAAATGAVEVAAVSARPIPEVPKFEKGGKVIAGGRNADGHLIGRSHRDGGILIEAQGGEYIWDRQTAQKHHDIIKAAHENRIEDLVLHKYVVPMLRATSSKAKSEQDIYDDKFLRNTVRETSKQSAKYIVNGISAKMDESIRNSQRYR